MTKTSSIDIPKNSWVDRLLPAAARPYARLARLDRPIGTWLLLFPCWWGISVVRFSEFWTVIIIAVLFAVGAVVMRGAGCTYNDLVDRDIDAKVERTRTRPLASGVLKPSQAIIFLALQLAIGLMVLLALGSATLGWGVASLGLVIIYPWMKRVTWWPQLFLGLAFNWGALMGYVAIAGHFDMSCLFLYIAGISWTLGYDTIYAHQDKEDDALIGVKSTARLFADNSRTWIAVFYAITLAFLVITAWKTQLSYAAAPFLIAAAVQLAWQVATINFSSPSDCLAKFRSNRFVGWLVLFGFIAGHFSW